LAEIDLLIFAFFFAFGTVSCLILLFSMRKQQENRMIVPLNTSSMHASAFLVLEKGLLPNFSRFA
jgi:hypothetical protein